MKKLVVVVALLALIFVGNRIVRASFQCAFPIFPHSSACLVHDILSGEDL